MERRASGGSGRRAVAALIAATILGGADMAAGGTGAAAGPAAEIPSVVVVGPTDNYAGLIAGVSEGLQAGGFRDASQIRIDIRNTRSFAQARKAIEAAVGEGADAIVTVFGVATRAAREAAGGVPVVFCPVADPVAAKYVDSAERPGGNLTGVASADAEAVGRRLDAFKRVVPRLERLGIFYDSSSSLDKTVLANLEQVAPGRGIRLVVREIADADTVVAALRELDRAQVDAVFILSDDLLRRSGEAIGRVAAERKIPLVVGDPDIGGPGILASVGPNQEKMGRLCGETVARILKGAKPGSLAVQHPPFDLVVSLKVAGELGVAVPEPAVSSASRVLR